MYDSPVAYTDPAERLFEQRRGIVVMAVRVVVMVGMIMVMVVIVIAAGVVGRFFLDHAVLMKVKRTDEKEHAEQSPMNHSTVVSIEPNSPVACGSM